MRLGCWPFGELDSESMVFEGFDEVLSCEKLEMCR